MKTRILLMVIGAKVLGSCSTMYKSGPTPDDVYFSPAAPESGYVSRENNNSYNRGGDYDDGYVDMSDRYLRMKSSSRRRWSTFDDDFMYWNNPMWNNSFMFNRWSRPGMGLSYGFGPMSWGNPFMMGHSPFMDPFMNPFANPYAGIGSFHNFGMGNLYGPTMGSFYGYGNLFGSPFSPYYYSTPVVVVTKPAAPINPRANGPRIYNLGGYGNSGSDSKSREFYGNNGTSPARNGVRTFGNSSSTPTRSSGGYINTENARPRGGYNNNDNPSRSSSNPVRTFESSSPTRSSGGGSGSNSSGGSSGGSAPVRSFPRGGGN
jgi:hypothetical protein